VSPFGGIGAAVECKGSRADAGKALLPETRKPHPWGSTAASLRQTVSGNNAFLRLRDLVGIIRDAAFHCSPLVFQR